MSERELRPDLDRLIAEKIAEHRQLAETQQRADPLAGLPPAYFIDFCDELEALLSAVPEGPPEPKNEWRLDDRGLVDDVIVENCTLRLERMGDDHVWGCVYRADGSRTDFNFHAKSKKEIVWTFEHETRSPDGDGRQAGSAEGRATAEPDGQSATTDSEIVLNRDREDGDAGKATRPAGSNPAESHRLAVPEAAKSSLGAETGLPASDDQLSGLTATQRGRDQNGLRSA